MVTDLLWGRCTIQSCPKHTYAIEHLSKSFDTAPLVVDFYLTARILEREYELVDLVRRHRQGAERFTDRVQRYMIAVSRQKLINHTLEDRPQVRLFSTDSNERPYIFTESTVPNQSVHGRLA